MLPTVDWKNGHVVMVDQRKLPTQEIYVELRTAREVARAIEKMVIRGAPAIGVAAARTVDGRCRRAGVEHVHYSDHSVGCRPGAPGTVLRYPLLQSGTSDEVGGGHSRQIYKR